MRSTETSARQNPVRVSRKRAITEEQTLGNFPGCGGGHKYVSHVDDSRGKVLRCGPHGNAFLVYVGTTLMIEDYGNLPGQMWLDGELMPWSEARLHVLSHALHYASSVFEGERAYGGTVFKEEEHTDRLIHSANTLGMEVPCSREDLFQARRAVLDANGITDGYIRPVVWRGSEMMGISAQRNTIHVAVAAWEWPSYFAPEARLKGIRLAVANWRRPSPETAPVNTKAAGLYMTCTLAKHAAESAGYDDALMLDHRGRVAETTGANIFFVRNGALHTPVPDCFLDGITRRTAIAIANAHGVEVIEEVIMPEDIPLADEVFVTGTAAEVTPVSVIGEHSFTPGPVCKLMIDEYTKLTCG